LPVNQASRVFGENVINSSANFAGCVSAIRPNAKVVALRRQKSGQEKFRKLGYSLFFFISMPSFAEKDWKAFILMLRLF
jgi:hypothetical protein